MKIKGGEIKMWISKKKLDQLKSEAAQARTKRGRWPCDMCQPTPEKGYVTYWCIVSNHVEVRFLVPNLAWSELEKSKEWKSFQDLLEKSQEEYIQKRLQTDQSKPEN